MTDGTKDEAARCVRIAEAAIASGDRERALKFVKIARRLDPSIPVDVLLDACEKLDGKGIKVPTEEVFGTHARKGPSSSKSSASASDRDLGSTEEHARLIREIGRSKDYYAVLGVDRCCSAEELRKAYRKLCLKVHPDKNKAPGAEEAFKAVCKAFNCLSDEGSRKLYDQVGSTADFEVNQPYHGGGTRRRRARATRSDFFDEGVDADEVFRSFFGYEGDALRARRVHRERAAAHQRRNSSSDSEGVGFLSLIQILPIFVIFMLVFLPYSEPEYFLRQSHTYHIPKITGKHGVEYYVRSEDFDHKYPQGSRSREKLEDDIFRDHMSLLRRYCNIELQRRQRLTNYPTPHCDKLRDFVAA